MNARLNAHADAPASLDGLLRPRAIALVGATERSRWSNGAFANLGELGYAGQVHVVNPRGGHIHGLRAAASCRAIGEPVDAALLMVPAHAIEDAFADLHEAGIANAVILTSGFAETGEDGARRQATLAGLARQHHVNLLGPNCLGLINYIDRIALWTIGLPTRLTGNVALISQSGATASYIADHAGRQGVGLSYIVSTGNEADLSVARLVDYMVDDEATRVICLFLETTRDTATLAAAARRALAAGKPVVALKIGTSPVTAKAAQAHTGSLVGDDRVFDAACRQLGIIRVHSIDDLVATAALLSRLRPRGGGNVAAIAISGGICEIAADRAEASGLALPELSVRSRDALGDVLPSFGTPHNPLDLTGAAILDPALFARSIEVLDQDPEIGLIACLYDLPTEPRHGYSQQVIQQVGQALSAASTPGVLLSIAPRPVPDFSRMLAEHHGLVYLGVGLDRGVAAIARAQWWARQHPHSPQPSRAALPAGEDVQRPRSERETLDFLVTQGVPVVPARMATDPVQAQGHAASFDGPVVLKIASPDIAHKSDVGGVRLDVAVEEAADAYQQLRHAVASARPDARIDGVLVSPMRRHGIELLVGVVRDPQWGPALAVGLGGVWVELFKDSSLRLLPVSAEDVLAMLGELRCSALLDGYRGGPVVDRRWLAEVIARIGDAALALGPDLASLEVNPLLASGGRVEALDGLVVWNTPVEPAQ